jgi:hypothetical protein
MIMKKRLIILVLILSGALITNAQIYTGSSNYKITDRLNKEYCSGIFKVNEATYIDLVNENESAQGYLNILDWLEGRIAGLQVYVTRDGVRMPFIRGSWTKVYVDEIEVDPPYLNTLPVNDIAMIKIIKGPSASIFGAGGVIAVYTLKGDENEEVE